MPDGPSMRTVKDNLATPLGGWVRVNKKPAGSGTRQLETEQAILV